ncbi:MAG: threonine/serine dehydratase [Bacteroidetes bacterium]|nr:threonine/serine dehydratase [Bacteroidota bacterium]
MSSRILLKRIEASQESIDPIFCNTPQFICEPLSDLLDVSLVLKIETINPIRCFKGRGAEWLISQTDPSKEIVCASAGNFGQAIAYSCRKRKMKVSIVASNYANPLKVERMKRLGAEVILYGDDFDSAKMEAKNIAQKRNARFVEDSLDVETVEGAGTIALELVKFIQPIDVLVVPLGNGAMINGMATVFRHVSPRTKIIAVQAEGAPAMVESWKQNQVINYNTTNTIADGVAVRLPVPQALEDMKGLVDSAWLVDDQSILEAMKLLHVHTGLVVEPSGALGLASIIKNKKLMKGKTVATIICGGNLTETQIKKWLSA